VYYFQFHKGVPQRLLPREFLSLLHAAFFLRRQQQFKHRYKGED
jgi:hypothetical protein